MSLSMVSSYHRGHPGNVPNKHAKGLFVAHLHEKRTNKEAKTLTIADLIVIQTEAFQHTAQHFLAFALWVLEHLDTRKASTKVLIDDVLVGTRLSTQRFVLVFNQLIAGP